MIPGQGILGVQTARDDPLAAIQLDESDYAWVTRELLEIADRHSSGRVISVLEGGYNLLALANSVAGHVREMLVL